MAKDSAKAKKETKKKAKKEPKKEGKKESKKEAKKESKKGKKETIDELEEIESRPEIEKPEALKAELEQPSPVELEQPTPGEEAKEIVEEKAEELKEEEKPEEVKEEAKVETVEEEAAEEEDELEIVEEKFYDLNLRRIWAAPRESRTPKAVRFLRDFVARRMKTDEVSISEEANSVLWARGISKPPRHLRVRAVKDKEGRVIVFPGEVK